VHDIADLESRGVVGMFVASREFMQAATAQSTSLGIPDLKRVFVPHPVQDRTDDELRTYADLVFEEIVDAVTASGTSSR
jgi:hypothetical protein